MTGTCATCGNPMPYRRKDGTILKREFCSRKCSHGQSVKITINGERSALPAAPSESWWLDMDRATFAATVEQRRPMLAVRFGSQPMATVGPMEAGWLDRARRVRREKERAY